MAGTIAIAAPLVQSEAGAHVIRAGIQYEALLRDHHDRWASLISTATGRDTERQRWARGERAARARLAPNRPTARAGAPHVFWHGPDRVANGRPVVVLVNGWTASGLLWPAGLVEQLERSYDVVRVDNRGSGYSRTAPAPFTMTQLADDVREVLRAIGARSATIVGLSMGGMIAQELALNHPSRVRSLILGCTACGGPQAVPATREVAAALGARKTMTREEAMWVMAPYIFDAGTPRERVAEDIAVRLQANVTNDGYFAQLGAVRAWSGTYDRLPSITMPTLVVHGETDQLVPPANGRIVAGVIPGAQLVTIPHASHIFFTDQFEATSGALLAFLASNG